MSKIPIKLLIADDEDNVRNGIASYIQSNSKCIDKIYQASDGQEALEKIFKHKPNLMLIDVRMPYKDGLTVMREALAAEICPKTIILSGHDEFIYAQQAIRCGTIDYLLKPCRPMDILAKLEKMIDKRERWQDILLMKHPEKIDDQANPFVYMAIEYINENFSHNVTLTNVAEMAGITPAYLSTLFTQNLGCGFVDYLNKVRVDMACSFFHDHQLKTYEVAYKVGFNDEKYFSKVFRKVMGISPSEYRKNNLEGGILSETRSNSNNFF